VDNTFIQEKLIPRLTFNPGLVLTGFRTTRPCCLNDLLHDHMSTSFPGSSRGWVTCHTSIATSFPGSSLHLEWGNWMRSNSWLVSFPTSIPVLFSGNPAVRRVAKRSTIPIWERRGNSWVDFRMVIMASGIPHCEHVRIGKECGCIPFVWKTKIFKWNIN